MSVVPDRGPLNFLTAAEARTHFGAWCIVSSPLVLSHDLTNGTTMDAVWPIIANREALAVNDAWVGDAGTLLRESEEQVAFENCAWGFDKFCNHSAWMVWKKALGPGAGPGGTSGSSSSSSSSSSSYAFLLMNNRNVTADVSVSWRDDLPRDALACPAAGCAVRDVFAHADLGAHADGFTAEALPPHDSAFIVVSTTPVAAPA